MSKIEETKRKFTLYKDMSKEWIIFNVLVLRINLVDINDDCEIVAKASIILNFLTSG